MNKLKVEDRSNFLTITVRFWSSLLVGEVDIKYFLQNRAQGREYMTWQPVVASSGIDVFLGDKVQSLEKAYYLRWGLPCPLPFDVNVNVRLTRAVSQTKALTPSCSHHCMLAALPRSRVQGCPSRSWPRQRLNPRGYRDLFLSEAECLIIFGSGYQDKEYFWPAITHCTPGSYMLAPVTLAPLSQKARSFSDQAEGWA